MADSLSLNIQKPNPKIQINSNNQFYKYQTGGYWNKSVFVWSIGAWSLVIVCYLVLVFWNFKWDS